jgi:hypothetical protein
MKKKIVDAIHNIDMAQVEMGWDTPFTTNRPDIAIWHFSNSLAQAGYISGDQAIHIGNAIQSGFALTSEIIAATGATGPEASTQGYRTVLGARTGQVGLLGVKM